MKPILFNTEMVRAILDGRKNVTRRVIKPQPDPSEELFYIYAAGRKSDIGKWQSRTPGRNWIPPFHAGDILYVRETWQYAYDLDGNERIIENTGRYLYAADGPAPFNIWITPDGDYRDTMPWRPSIHMPKEAARIFLRVVRVSVEHLNQMEVADYIKEGTRPRYFKKDGCRCVAYTDNCENEPCPNRDAYETLLYSLPFSEIWDSTIKRDDRIVYGYTANPWVWVIDFEQISRDEAMSLAK